MGTSQSHSLKTTPQWASAKRAMTGIIHDIENPNRFSSFMGSFLDAIEGEGLYRGASETRYQRRLISHKHAFGTAGGGVAIDFLDFISEVKDNGLSTAISLFQSEGDEAPSTPRDLINQLCSFSAKETDANLDADAATVAQRKLLAEIFKQCDTLADVETILKEADEDSIDAWIIFFEVEYIIEYQGSLFQSHIFDKTEDPESVLGQRRRWLHAQLDTLLSEEMHHLNLFSKEGKSYIDKLTSRILDIWKHQ